PAPMTAWPWASLPPRADSRTSSTMSGGVAARAPRPDPPEPDPSRNAPAPQAAGYRPIDKTGNNRANPNCGRAGTDLLRGSPVGYADGISAPSLPQDPSARAISNILNNQAGPNDPSQDMNTVDQQSLSDFGYVFGQFMDHDLDLTPDGGASF